jgi:xanthine dehydrogenase YagR molybdenum-binding subunit
MQFERRLVCRSAWRDRHPRVEIAGHEIGTGAYTVIAQAAADRLGIPYENVSVALGDGNLPPAPVAGGSNSTASTGSAVIMVCDQIRERLFRGFIPSQGLLDKTKETVGIGRTEAMKAAQAGQPLDREKAFDALGVGAVEEYGEWKPEGAPKDALEAMHRGPDAFGAEFVEVRVHRLTR